MAAAPGGTPPEDVPAGLLASGTPCGIAGAPGGPPPDDITVGLPGAVAPCGTPIGGPPMAVTHPGTTARPAMAAPEIPATCV
ncbi:hypothetical protein [Mycobacterium angelicum]|uniref:hypothetical protein n=1 Tax=Mycobacterium angelicum TaxID=470074 RepID=UPI00111C194E|nr:hypothetical protein [Mycobacterium angelicum]